MSDIDNILIDLERQLERKNISFTSSKSWVEGVRDYRVISHYIALHPDLKESPDSQLTLSILTERGLHNWNYKFQRPVDYVYCPLRKIEWVREYKMLDRASYIVSIQIPKSNLIISDFSENIDRLRLFAHLIRKQIEEC